MRAPCDEVRAVAIVGHFCARLRRPSDGHVEPLAAARAALALCRDCLDQKVCELADGSHVAQRGARFNLWAAVETNESFNRIRCILLFLTDLHPGSLLVAAKKLDRLLLEASDSLVDTHLFLHARLHCCSCLPHVGY